MDPPPLPTIITSTFSLLRASIPLTMDSAAPSPWTWAGARRMSAGKSLPEVVTMSWMTAPLSDVTTPMTLGYTGSFLFLDVSNIPSASSFFLSISYSRNRSPIPEGVMVSTMNWYLPLATYRSTCPKAETFMLSLGSKSILPLEPLNSTELIWLPSSFSVK